MPDQVKYILPKVKSIAANYDKIIAIGYSQVNYKGYTKNFKIRIRPKNKKIGSHTPIWL